MIRGHLMASSSSASRAFSSCASTAIAASTSTISGGMRRSSLTVGVPLPGGDLISAVDRAYSIAVALTSMRKSNSSSASVPSSMYLSLRLLPTRAEGTLSQPTTAIDAAIR